MKYNSQTSGFSIVLAMWLALLLSYIWLFLLDYMIPFSRNIKWIENASQAYYESYGWLEDALFTGATNPVWFNVASASSQWYNYSITGSWNVIPVPGLGNSRYSSNKDWNKLSQNEPIQLVVWRGRLGSWWANRIRISLRVPDFDGDSIPDSLKTSDGDSEIILWQLTSATSSISTRDGEFITESDINLWITDGSLWTSWVSSYWEGVMTDGTDRTFQWFYNNNSSPCADTNNECVLKISVINPLISASNNSVIPFIEYQIETNSALRIPLRYSQIESDGNSIGYNKKLNISVPQQTTNSAFDFTIFQ